MGGHELDECGWPAEWAVDPGLVGLTGEPEDGLVVGPAGDSLDDGAPGSPSDAGGRGPLGLRAKVNPGGDHLPSTIAAGA
jgi:hypothetical protein